MIDNFSLEECANHWLVCGVNYLGKICDVEIDKQRIDNGKFHTLAEFETLSDRIPDAPLETAVVVALYQNKDGIHSNKIEEVRKNILLPDFKDWIMTKTSITYQPNEKDVVNHKTYSVIVDIIGPDTYFEQGKNLEDISEAILGNKDINLVKNAYEWASEKLLYLCRLNNKPQVTTEWAVVLGRNVGNRFSIDCYGIVDNVRPARGIVITQKKSAEKTINRVPDYISRRFKHLELR